MSTMYSNILEYTGSLTARDGIHLGNPSEPTNQTRTHVINHHTPTNYSHHSQLQVMEYQLPPGQEQLFKQLVGHLQTNLDPIVREGCAHLSVKIVIQNVLITLPLPYALDLRRTYSEVEGVYMEARCIYRFLMFISDTRITTRELSARMSREVQLISMSEELYEGLCEIAGQCSSGEHTTDCPKAYLTMKMMTYWYLFQIYYMFLNQTLIVQHRVIRVNPISAIRHREITGVCTASRGVKPTRLQEVTSGYLHEKADIRQLLTKRHPEGLASHIFSYMESQNLGGLREAVLTNYLRAAEDRYNYRLAALSMEGTDLLSSNTLDRTDNEGTSSDSE